MTKKDRKGVISLFDQFMDEEIVSYHDDYLGQDREHAWIIRSPFGPISVMLDEPDHRRGFTLFCQVLLFPSNYPNGKKHWYQFDHWKQNCHLPNYEDGDAVLEELQQHVLRLLSTRLGAPSERDLIEQIRLHSARSTSKAGMLLRYFKHYDKKYKAEGLAPGAAGKSTLELV